MLWQAKTILKKLLTSAALSAKKVAARWEIWSAGGTTKPRFLTSQLCSDIALTHVLCALWTSTMH